MKSVIAFLPLILIIFSVQCKSTMDQKTLLKFIKDMNKISDESNKHFSVGKDLHAKEEFKEALKEYSKSIEIIGKAVERCEPIKDDSPILDMQFTQSRGMMAITYYFRGMTNMDIGSYDAAIVDFSKTIKIYPKHQASFFRRGRAHSKKGDFKKAMADLKKSGKLLPRDPYPKYFMACAYAAQRKEKEALEALDQTAQLVLDNIEGEPEDVNKLRKYWHYQMNNEEDLKSISKNREYRNILSKLRKRYR